MICGRDSPPGIKGKAEEKEKMEMGVEVEVEVNVEEVVQVAINSPLWIPT